MAKNYFNTAVITIDNNTASRVEVFSASQSNKFKQLQEGRVDEDTVLTTFYVEKAMVNNDTDLAKAVYGATVLIEAGSSKVELGTLQNWVKSPSEDKDNFRLPVPVGIPAGTKYKIVIEYSDLSQVQKLDGNSGQPVDLIIRVEGEQ
ncbi:MAG: hypothetical protein GXO22_07315 [Aquificae bacterium]|nr:hypothetical protein [Aquificota bacterium]